MQFSWWQRRRMKSHEQLKLVQKESDPRWVAKKSGRKNNNQKTVQWRDYSFIERNSTVPFPCLLWSSKFEPLQCHWQSVGSGWEAGKFPIYSQNSTLDWFESISMSNGHCPLDTINWILSINICLFNKLYWFIRTDCFNENCFISITNKSLIQNDNLKEKERKRKDKKRKQMSEI